MMADPRMDFSIPERMQEYPGAIRDLMVREVCSLEPALLSKPFSELVPDLRAVRQKVKALGLWAPHIPRSQGGLGLELRRVRPGRRRARYEPARPYV